MPEVFLEFLGNASPWLFLLMIPLYFWGKLNYDALNSHDTHQDSFRRVIGWLKQENFGALYLQFLGGVSDKVSDLIGDREKLNQIYVTADQPKGFIHTAFGFNPFTAKSYEKCLYLAFLYPVISFIISFLLSKDNPRIGHQIFMNNIIMDKTGDYGYIISLILALGVIGEMFTFRLFNGLLCTNTNSAMSFAKAVLGLFLVSVMFLYLIAFFGNDSHFEFIDWYVIVAIIGLFVVRDNLNDIYKISITVGLLFLSAFYSIEVVRYSLLAFSVFFITIYTGGWFLYFYLYRSTKKAHELSCPIVMPAIIYFLLYISGDTSFDVALVFSIVFALTVSGIVAINFISIMSIILSIFTISYNIFDQYLSFFLFMLIGILMAIFHVLHERSLYRTVIGKFWSVYTLFFIAIGYICLYNIKNTNYMLLLLFWLLLPLVNAPLDWISLGVTRGLLQAVRVGQHSGMKALGFASADLLLALVFLFLITALLVGVTALGNGVAGKTLVDIGGILQQVSGVQPPAAWAFGRNMV
jgi:hypothetical protein